MSKGFILTKKYDILPKKNKICMTASQDLGETRSKSKNCGSSDG
jgi:hypothetical protein